jgi:hypothetical protein
LVAAGVEGGSKKTILEDWDLPEIARLREHWAEYGPPVHIALAAFASGWGMTLTASPSIPAYSADPLQGLGNLPMAELTRPRLGLPSTHT